MKILYHHRTRAEDAQGIHIQEMVKAFRDLGHEVEMVALVRTSDGDSEKTRRNLWSRLTRFMPDWLYDSMSLAYNLYGYKNLCQAIRSKKPDIIYERYSLNTFCGIIASRRFGIPLILEVNAPLYHEQKKLGKLTLKRLARFSERWICSNSTWTIVVSNVIKEILKQAGVQDEKIVVMPNGIDTDIFNPEISGMEVRQKYGLDGKIVIGFVGWFRKWHGLDMLLKIMYEAQLAERCVRLLLVGDGPAYDDLYRYVEQYNLKSSVIFTGPVKRDEIPFYIAAMDIAVQPDVTDYACPIKIIEYMAMGKCIVAPDKPNIREILDDGITGFLFQPGNKKSLRLVLEALVENPDKKEEIGLRAREHIFKRDFLWLSNAQKVLSL